MVDIDEIAGTKRNFQKAACCNETFNRKAVLRAVEALDGEISVHWE